MPLRGATNNEYSDGNGDITLFAGETIHIAQDICCAYPSRPVGDRRSKRHFSLFATRRRTNRTWCYSTMDMGVALIADPDRSTANLCLMVQSD